MTTGKSNQTTVPEVAYDNRGTEEHPFGFVYLGDPVRVVYIEKDGRITVLTGSGGWKDPNLAQRRQAAEFLKGRFPDYEVVVTEEGE